MYILSMYSYIANCKKHKNVINNYHNRQSYASKNMKTFVENQQYFTVDLVKNLYHEMVMRIKKYISNISYKLKHTLLRKQLVFQSFLLWLQLSKKM